MDDKEVRRAAKALGSKFPEAIQHAERGMSHFVEVILAAAAVRWPRLAPSELDTLKHAAEQFVDSGRRLVTVMRLLEKKR